MRIVFFGWNNIFVKPVKLQRSLEERVLEEYLSVHYPDALSLLNEADFGKVDFEKICLSLSSKIRTFYGVTIKIPSELLRASRISALRKKPELNETVIAQIRANAETLAPAIISSTDTADINLTLRQSELSGLINPLYVFSSPHLYPGLQPPSEHIFVYAMRALETTPSDCGVLTSNLRSIMAASKAGIGQIIAYIGHEPPHEQPALAQKYLEAGATEICKTISVSLPFAAKRPEPVHESYKTALPSPGKRS